MTVGRVHQEEQVCIKRGNRMPERAPGAPCKPIHPVYSRDGISGTGTTGSELHRHSGEKTRGSATH